MNWGMFMRSKILFGSLIVAIFLLMSVGYAGTFRCFIEPTKSESPYTYAGDGIFIGYVPKDLSLNEKCLWAENFCSYFIDNDICNWGYGIEVFPSICKDSNLMPICNSVKPCPECPYCGNGICDSYENYYYCPEDCDINNEITLANGYVFEVFVSNLPYGVSGLTFDQHDNLYTVDTNSDSVLKITPDGTLSTFVNLPAGAGVTIFAHMIFDSKDNLFVSDPGTGAFGGQSGFISKITPDGSVSKFATVEEPIGIAIDSNDNLFVGDGVAWGEPCNILKITPDGTVNIFASNVLSGTGLQYTSGLVFDSDGNLYAGAVPPYIASPNPSLILKINQNGEIDTFATLGSNVPTSLVFDNSGNLFIGDGDTWFEPTGIFIISPEGSVNSFLSGAEVAGLAFDKNNNLFVLATGNLGSGTPRVILKIGKDSDNDGIMDSSDKCPNTIGKQLIYGCSCEQILTLKPGQDTSKNRADCSLGIIDVFGKAIGWAKDLFG
jgi:hypothetical protein